MSVDFYQTIRRHTPSDGSLYSRRCENRSLTQKHALFSGTRVKNGRSFKAERNYQATWNYSGNGNVKLDENWFGGFKEVRIEGLLLRSHLPVCTFVCSRRNFRH